MAYNEPVLRRLDSPSANEIDSAVQVLIEAYTGDHTIETLTAGLKSAESLMFRRSIEEALKGGECHIAYDGRDACGVAVWLSPRSDWRCHEDSSFIEALANDMREWYADHFAPVYEKLYASAGLESTVARKGAWKLLWLGVIPNHRRRGIASRLIETVTTKADEDRKKVIVEVTDPERVNQFQRYGFKYRSVKNISCGRYPGFPIWYLERESGPTPRSSGVQP
ncbi:uncharacterized protein PHACADRAFT_194242 [Phanerochaete carnosa HHB-10118-sp]|uniref:N-acetyltransferase domain-containing protein n=1 Tax=Phanerochaete carnosa (strain HHB-10118-sp) TaxID=650164 RepID=K5WBQ6_PHACS|nr:uncharacterized protein PHACADRAFT_194242 [Phanerochaete carnosa HHB-10118-sp]EKM56650.1 hypothetical protein PHACADRAFT_194242 [Phanerochaete carnosa HHB-10118-sp]